MTATFLRSVLEISNLSFLQLWLTPYCWTFCKLMSGTFYQPFLYSMELTSVSVWSLWHMIHMIRWTSTIPSMALAVFLNSVLAFIIVESVFARVIRHRIWYRSSIAVFTPSAYFTNNSWFWSRVAISHNLVSDWIVLAVDTLPFNVSHKKHAFNRAIGMTNLIHVLHWLTHSYVSLCLRLRTPSSFKAQCLPHHLTGLGQCALVMRSFLETAWNFSKIVLSRASSWYLALGWI